MKFKSGDMYVDVFVEDFRTRVRLPAPPPIADFNKKATCLRVAFLLPRPKAACSGSGGSGHPGCLLIYS